MLLSDARTLAAYLLFFGSSFVFALGKFPEGVPIGCREYFRIRLPVALLTLAAGSIWLTLSL